MLGITVSNNSQVVVALLFSVSIYYTLLGRLHLLRTYQLLLFLQERPDLRVYYPLTTFLYRLFV